MKKKLLLSVLFYIIVHCTLNIENCEGQWVQCNLPVNDNVTSLSLSSITVFAGTGSNGIYKTTNNGTNWTQTQLMFTNTKALFSYGYTTYASGINNGILRTTNWGTNWIPTSLGNGYSINCFTNLGTWFYAGGVNINGSVFLSYNEGVNWGPVLFDEGTIYSLAGMDTNVYAGSSFSGGKIYNSTNRGMNWSDFNLYNIGGSTPYSLAASCYGYVFAGTATTGVFVSPNKGITWSQTSLINKRVNAMVVVFNFVFAGTQDSGIYKSTDNGQTWIKINQGFPSPLTINSLLVANNYLYAGTNYNTSSVWKRSLSEFIIGIETNQNAIPGNYSLFQNYPNPFNPTTKISYKVESYKVIKLVVYDILGKEVETLVNERQSPGTYEVSFNVSNISSGIYFYSLFVDDMRIDTKRMILLK